MDESPTRDELSGWRSSGASVSLGGAHPGKNPGPLERHKVNFVLQTAGRQEREAGIAEITPRTRLGKQGI